MKSNGQANDGDDFRDKSGVSDPLAAFGVCPPHEGDSNASKTKEASLPLARVSTYLEHPAFRRGGNFEIGRKPISNPKSEISNWTGSFCKSNLIFRISDLKCRIRPISKFFFSV